MTRESHVDANLQYADHLRNSLYENSRQYDSAILALSSGLLTLSVAFIRDLASTTHAELVWALVVSWAALAGSSALTIASFLTSGTGIRWDLAEFYRGNQGRSSGMKWHYVTVWLNYLAGTLFLTGAILTIVFVANNITLEDTVRDDERTEKIDRGYVPPQRPGRDEEKGYVPPPPPPPKDSPKDSGEGKGSTSSDGSGGD